MEHLGFCEKKKKPGEMCRKKPGYGNLPWEHGKINGKSKFFHGPF
jgi:hypothetical protein